MQAAKEVDGAIVKPGETFSLNGHTGPRGYAEGYNDAPVIVDGKLTPGVGGGISQFTTTLFNAAYYAGLEDVEHKPHSYWFSRYPSVIESTIFYPTLDLKFRNNTAVRRAHRHLVHRSDSITVSMWSTKVYDSVKTEWSAKRDVTQPKTITLQGRPGVHRYGRHRQASPRTPGASSARTAKRSSGRSSPGATMPSRGTSAISQTRSQRS